MDLSGAECPAEGHRAAANASFSKRLLARETKNKSQRLQLKSELILPRPQCVTAARGHSRSHSADSLRRKWSSNASLAAAHKSGESF